MTEPTDDQRRRAGVMIDCGLDHEQVAQWLANHEADKAEIKRLQAESASTVDSCVSAVTCLEAERDQLRREVSDLRSMLVECHTEVERLRGVLDHIANEGPVQRFGSNTGPRLLQWVRAVRTEAAEKSKNPS